MTDLTAPIFTDPNAAREHFEAIRWPNGPVCPHCGVENEATLVKGKSHRPGLYQCNSCREPFTVTVGTVMESSHIPLQKWALGFHLMASSKKGISAHQLHRMLGIHYRSAWFMAHRIREAMKDTDPTPLGGKDVTVEADELFAGPPVIQFKNDRGWAKKRGSHARRDKILTLVERGGKARSFQLKATKLADIDRVLAQHLSLDSTLHTDDAGHYKSLGVWFAKHESVNHTDKEYARGDVTTNSVEGFFSIFRRGMIGIYQHCSEQHLQRYLSEFDFRYSYRAKLGYDDEARTVKAIKGADGKRLKYA